jgi:hypothetical protein
VRDLIFSRSQSNPTRQTMKSPDLHPEPAEKLLAELREAYDLV